ncbi:MAG: fibronectin type III domain-containing protein, partial [Ilumatobacteraceae bacterium]
TDGTEAGTVLVKDIAAGTNFGFPISGDPSNFFILNGKLWFSAYSEPSGYELWSSDGTEAGTNLLGDFNTIPNGNVTASFSPRSAVVLGTTAVFNATGTSGGEELWVTDGTVTGTHMVVDLYPGSSYGNPNSSFPNYLTLANGKVYFYATTAAAGNEPWVTDGTEAGTTSLGDLNPGSNGSALYCGGCASPLGRFNAYGDRVLFTANVTGFGNEPWITDGTAAGTRILADLRPGSTGSTGLNWSYTISGLSISQWRSTVSNSWFRIVNGRALFSADSGLTGNELWAFVSPPGSPRNVTAGASPNSATVSWSPPTSSGAGVITSYTVVSNPGAFTCTTTTTSCTITGLLSNQDYTFSVTATTELGSSPVPGVSGRVRTPSPQLGSLVESLPVVTDMVSNTNLKQGSTITVLYRGFDPNEMVLLLLASNPTVIGSANADDNGNVAITGFIPPGAETGAHNLVLYAPISGFGATQAITVSSSTPSGPVIEADDLAATGRGQHPTVYAWVFVLAGIGLLAGRQLIRPTFGNPPPRAR